jgi:hypothetical protein
MTFEELKKAKELEDEIGKVEHKLMNAKNYKCEWIEFTSGNGSSKANVCNDNEIILLVRDLIIDKYELKLKELLNKFNNL